MPARGVALEALKTFMASDPRTKEIPGLPTQTFAKDYTLKFGGAEVRLYSFGRGHSGGDTMVYFPDAKVVMVSDQMTDNAPIVDFANGGSAVGWAPILDGVLKLDFEMAIPGRGEPKTRADVEAYRTKFATVVTRASDAIKAGATRETLAMQVKTDDIGWNFNAQFYGSLYDELTKKWHPPEGGRHAGLRNSMRNALTAVAGLIVFAVAWLSPPAIAQQQPPPDRGVQVGVPAGATAPLRNRSAVAAEMPGHRGRRRAIRKVACCSRARRPQIKASGCQVRSFPIRSGRRRSCRFSRGRARSLPIAARISSSRMRAASRRAWRACS